MTDIVALLHALFPSLSNTTLRQMQHIIFAMLCIPDRITMLNIARWAERGGSYRTVQRWYHTPLDWAAMMWNIIQTHLLEPEGEYLLAADEVVISKAGTATHGRGRFYSSLAQRPIDSISLKAQFRARRYLDETIKMLPDPPDDDLVSRIWRRLTALSGIRVRPPDRSAA